MTETPSPARKRAPYKIKGPDTWVLIETEYLAGATAPFLAARYGVTAEAIRRRAGRQGWTKRDGASPPPKGPPPSLVKPADAEAAKGDPGTLAQLCLGGVSQALGQGRLDEAKMLAQLAEALIRLAKAERPESIEERVDAEVQRRADLRRDIDARIARIRADLEARKREAEAGL